MLDPTRTSTLTTPHTAVKPRPVLHMGTSDRMAGSIPVWGIPTTAKDTSLAQLDAAASERSFQDVLDDALAYSPGEPVNVNDEPFGFGDLIDIVNPLQHIPLVGMAYRAITGDTIRPSSQIIGGAVFGGPLGAASGLANVIIQDGTGKNIEGHVMASLFPAPGVQDETLSRLAAEPTTPALPAHALGFAPSPIPGHSTATAAKQVWKFNE